MKSISELFKRAGPVSSTRRIALPDQNGGLSQSVKLLRIATLMLRLYLKFKLERGIDHLVHLFRVHRH